jgi:hypothetical protein
MEVAVFCLVRGKSTIFGYRGLILRNWSLRRNMKVEADQRVSYIVFHEGNVSKLQQSLIRFVSGIQINFSDIGAIFTPFPNQTISENRSAAGYSLMCRFMYLQVWELLSDFDMVARVDDDCVVFNLPLKLSDDLVFQGGILIEDGHKPTNDSLPEVLGPKRSRHWGPNVANTCVFVTRMSFWAKPEVIEFLREIGEHNLALEKRWGDHRVLGIALKMFGKWESDNCVINPQIDYLHFSHNQRIRKGSKEDIVNLGTLVILFRRLSYWSHAQIAKVWHNN